MYRKKTTLSRNLKENIEFFQEMFKSSDFVFRKFNMGPKWENKAVLFFLEGMIDKDIINENIIKPLQYDVQFFTPDKPVDYKDIKVIRDNLLPVGEVTESTHWADLVEACLRGDSILLIDGISQGLIISTSSQEKSKNNEAKGMNSGRGPQEKFGDILQSNLVQLRRRIQNSDLVFEEMKMGTRTNTSVVIAYFKGIASEEIITEVKKRLAGIKIDAMLDSGYIEQLIEDAPFSVFPTIGNTNKPDVAAARVLEGRIAILVDGSPTVLTVPYVFVESFQVVEDYYNRPYYASIIRVLRYFSYFLGILSPAVYVALASFHQNFIPTGFLLTMAQEREGLPFPVVIETLIIGIIFEILRIAGMKLPYWVGVTISIIGGIIIGEVAALTGLAGGAIVITITLTGIASFVVVDQADSSAVLRLLLVVLAGILGAFGIVIGMLAVLIHLCSLRSFGVSYLVFFTISDLKDTFVRAPLWMMQERPDSIPNLDDSRMAAEQMPRPSKGKE